MFTQSSSARRRVAAALALVLTLQPAFAATATEYRIPLFPLKTAKPPVTKPDSLPGSNPGYGDGDVDTGLDPEAARKPELEVSPASLQFESNPDYHPVSHSSFITNVGPVPTMVGGLESTEHFTVKHDCPDSLPVEGMCTVTVTPTSAAPGPVRYRMGIIAPGAEEQKSIELSTVERNSATPYPRLAPSEEIVYLGDLNPDERAQGSTTITNQGTAPAILSGITSNKYFAVTNNCPAELLPGASCTISASFQAYDAKSYAHTLMLRTGTPEDEGTPLTFMARVKSNPALMPSLAFDETNLSFGILEQGGSATKKLVLTNRGTAPAELKPLTGNKDFDVSSNCPGLLAAKASCEVHVTFNARVAGASPGIVVRALAQDDVEAEALVSGQVKADVKEGAPAPELVFEPEQHLFGALPVGQKATGTVKLVNKGTVAATLTSLAIDSGSSNYQLTHTCGTAVEPAASCEVTVTFTPTGAVSYPGRIKATPSAGSAGILMLSGTGEQAQLSVGPAIVDFGATAGFTPTKSRIVSLSNSGNVPLTGLNLVNKNSRLTVEPGTCTTTLEPKKGCAMSIRYAPDALGTFAGEFQITATNGGAKTVAWSGMAVHLEASPTALAFPATRVRTSAPDQNVQLTNLGPAAVPFSGIGMLAGASSFGQANNCDKSLAAGASCSIAVRFTPDSKGVKHSSVDVVVGGELLVRVGLSGEGLAPQLEFSSTTLRFPDTNIGQSSPALSVLVSNPTDETATLTSTGLTSGEAEFKQTNNCGASLSPGQSCTATVTMTPKTLEGSSGAWTVVSSFGSQSVSLSGRGTEAKAGIEEPITPPPGGVDDGFTHYAIKFLDTQVGYPSAVRDVKFTNRGTGPLNVESIGIVNGQTDFSQSNDCGATLAPSAYCTISILFKPTATGERLGGIALLSDGGRFFFDLKGTGIGAEGNWRADSSADYGSVGVNSKNLRNFTFTNTGTVAATAIETVVEGDNVRLTANTCGVPGSPVALAVGTSCRATVEYAPTAPGDMKATLKTTGTLANGPVVLALSGKALPPAMVYDATPSADFGTLTVNTTTSRTYVLRNTGPLTDTLAAAPDLKGVGFTRNGGSCQSGTSLAPNAACTITVEARPTASGAMTGKLSVLSAQGALAVLDLKATGIQSNYEISASPSASTAPTADFGKKTVGSAAVSKTYYLRDSTSISRVSASKVSIVGDNDFELNGAWVANSGGSVVSSCTFNAAQTTAPCTTTAAGQVVRISVAFNPRSAGVKNAVLRFEHNGTGGVSELPLTGEALFNATGAWSTSPSSVVAPTAATLDWGTKAKGTVTTKEFYVRNVGTNGAQSLGFALSGDTSQFKIVYMYTANGSGSITTCTTGGVISATGVTPCLAQDIQGGAYPHLRFKVEYAPTTLGNHTLTFTPTTNNGTTLPETMTMTARGEFSATAAWSNTPASTIAPTTADLNFGSKAVGTSTYKSVFLRNVGTFGAQIVGATLSGDTSHFKINRITIASSSVTASNSECVTGGVVNADKTSFTPCEAHEVSRNFQSHLRLYIQYTPLSAGTHNIAISLTTSNGTVIPGEIVMTGTSP